MRSDMLIILFFSAFCFFLTITAVSANDVKEGLEIGDKAPDFKLNTLEGETLQLSDFRGERIMLNFWATWCPPCRQEMPDMERFYKEHAPIIFSVNLTNE